LYARSASDDKAPIIGILTALDGMRAAGLKPTINLKLVFEGEEEAGSANLGKILERNKELLKSDVWLICDGPVDQSRKRQIVFGARGVQTVDLTVYGPKRELHSGHYGNWAPNPALMLARLLASMKEEDGHILIDGFYDGMLPLSDLDRKAIAELPDNDQQLKQELWLGRTEGGNKSLSELITLPSLNIRGMGAARIGAGASNVIPANAMATIDMRLVRGVTKDHVVDAMRKHIEKQGYFITDIEPASAVRLAHPKVAWLRIVEGGYDAVRTPLDQPMARIVVKAVEDAFGPVMKRPNSGGSVPLYMIEEILHVPTISTPIANHDNSQHTFNENIRIRNLWDGIDLFAALLVMK
jgi:acetylornithine deacetylase/succinyl-diaminopimelate desuccinylase-like protein